VTKRLDKVRGKEFFAKLLKLPVYSSEGELLGVIKRIVLKRSDWKAKELHIETSSGQLIKLRPKDVSIVDGRLIAKVSTSKIVRKPRHTGRKSNISSQYIEKLEKIVKELNALDSAGIETDIGFVRGEIDRTTYFKLKKQIARRRSTLISEMIEILNRLARERSSSLEPVDEGRLIYYVERLKAEVGDEYSFEEFIDKFLKS